MLLNSYSDAAISERAIHEWFQRYKKNDFYNDGRDDAEYDTLLNEDSYQVYNHWE